MKSSFLPGCAHMKVRYARIEASLASGTITAADLMEPTLTVDQLAAELLGGTSFYVNVHTAECPDGAISGDLLLQGDV